MVLDVFSDVYFILRFFSIFYKKWRYWYILSKKGDGAKIDFDNIVRNDFWYRVWFTTCIDVLSIVAQQRKDVFCFEYDSLLSNLKTTMRGGAFLYFQKRKMSDGVWRLNWKTQVLLVLRISRFYCYKSVFLEISKRDLNCDGEMVGDKKCRIDNLFVEAYEDLIKHW